MTDAPAPTPDPTPAPTPSPTPAPTPSDTLQALQEQLAQCLDSGTPVQVEVLRVTAAGREPLALIDGDKFDPFTLQARFGACKVMARIRLANGRYGKSATFPLGEASPGDITPPRPSLAGQDLIALLIQQGQQSQQNMMAMMQAQMQQMGSIVAAIAGRPRDGINEALLTHALKSNNGSMTETIKALRELQDMMPAGEGKSEVGELVTALAPLIPMIAARGQAAASAPAPQQRPQRRQVLQLQPDTTGRGPAPAITPAAQAPAHAPTTTPAPAGSDITPPAVVELKGTTPAAPNTDAEVLQEVCRIMEACYTARLSPAVAAGAVFELLDSSPAGGKAAQSAMATPGETFAGHLGMLVPAFATDAGRAYALAAIGELKEIIQEDQEDAAGVNADPAGELDQGDDQADGGVQ